MGNDSLIEALEAIIEPEVDSPLTSNSWKNHNYTVRKCIEVVQNHMDGAREEIQGDAKSHIPHKMEGSVPTHPPIETAFQRALEEFGAPDDEYNCWHIEEGGLRQLVYKTIEFMGDASTRKDEVVHNGDSPTIGGSPSEIPVFCAQCGQMVRNDGSCKCVTNVIPATKPVSVGESDIGMIISEDAHAEARNNINNLDAKYASEGDFRARDALQTEAESGARGAQMTQQPDETPSLPHDVTIGDVTFRKGVALKTLVEAAGRWQKAAQDAAVQGIDLDAAKTALRLPNAGEGPSSDVEAMDALIKAIDCYHGCLWGGCTSADGYKEAMKIMQPYLRQLMRESVEVAAVLEIYQEFRDLLRNRTTIEGPDFSKLMDFQNALWKWLIDVKGMTPEFYKAKRAKTVFTEIEGQS